MGVRSQTRAILKMTNCTYSYPGAKKPQLLDVSCAVSLSSRVGIGAPFFPPFLVARSAR